MMSGLLVDSARVMLDTARYSSTTDYAKTFSLFEIADIKVLLSAALSFFDGTRRYFTADTAAFLDSANGSEIGWETDDPADPIEETLILALRTADGLDLTAFSALAGKTATGKIGTHLDKLIPCGLACRTAHGYALTAEGVLVSNTILSDLLLLL